jgi:hypothetical protein
VSASSLFGRATDVDRRIWQHRNLAALTELVKLGEKRKLPPLFWTLPSIGTVSGRADSLLGEQHPRAVFEAWHAALSAHPRMEPRGLGLRNDEPPRRERTNDVGLTHMIAAFELRLPSQSRCDIAIIAEWFEDNFTKDGAK